MDYTNVFNSGSNEIHSYSVRIARKYGMNAALLFNNIYYWVRLNYSDGRNYYDGYYWTYNKCEAFAFYFPELSENQIRYAFKKLIDEGLIKTGNYNKSKFDKTLWYTITEKGYKEFNGGELPTEPDNTSNMQNQHIRISDDEMFEMGDFPPLDEDSHTSSCEDSHSDTKQIPNNKTKRKTNGFLTVSGSVIPNDPLVERISEILGRSLRYKEKEVLHCWLEEGIDTEVIQVALEDNDYRGVRNSLIYVDETIRQMIGHGVKTSLEAKNYVLDHHVENTKILAGKVANGNKDKYDVIVNSNRECYIQEWRDAIVKLYSEHNLSELRRLGRVVSQDVAEYLSPEISAILW